MPGSEIAFAYTPAGIPQLAVDDEGVLAASCVGSRIAIFDLELGAAIAEIDGDPDGNLAIGWLGDRLLVVTGYARETVVQVFDPEALHPISEKWFDARLRLVGTSAGYAIVTGPATAVLELVAGQLVARQLTQAIAGAAGPAVGQVAIGVAAAVELWEPRARTVRTLRMLSPIVALGGTARCAWATTELDPSAIEVVSLAEPAERWRLWFPEPIAHVAGHPRAEVVACAGASGRLYIAHLDGSRPVHELATGAIERVSALALVVGERTSVWIAQPGRRVALVDIGDIALGPSAEPSAIAPIQVTAALATLLRERTDLAPPLVAAITAIDAMERGTWPALPFDRLLDETPAADRDELRAALALLRACGVVLDGDRGPMLDPGARQVLAEVRQRPAPVAGELGRLLEPSGAAIVITGGAPADHLRALREATARAIAVVGADVAIGELRDLWLAGVIALLELERADDLAVLELVARVPVRLVCAVEPAWVGEALARLRPLRSVTRYWPPSAPPVEGAVPPALAPLFSSTWHAPAVRVAAVRGTREAVVAAARAVAAAKGVALHTVAGEVRALRDGLAAAPVVLLVRRTAALAPLEAHVIASLIERGKGIVLVDGDGIAPQLTRVIAAVIDV